MIECGREVPRGSFSSESPSVVLKTIEEMVQLLQENYMMMLKRLKIELSHDPAIPLLSTHQKELKTGTPTDICTPMSVEE